MTNHPALIRALLRQHGRTYAEEATIALADKPGPLYQLLVLATLLSTRIRATVALAAARELFTAGYRTPQRMLSATWQDRVDALGRGHYRRYDERTATMLGDGARLCLNHWQGDLRRLHHAATGDTRQLHTLLTEFPGIGPTGADIFLREAQAVWPDIRPHIDRRALTGARRLHLPTNPEKLATMVDGPDLSRFASALVRVTLDTHLAEHLPAAG